jgi:hypothetical protein
MIELRRESGLRVQSTASESDALWTRIRPNYDSLPGHRSRSHAPLRPSEHGQRVLAKDAPAMAGGANFRSDSSAWSKLGPSCISEEA